MGAYGEWERQRKIKRRMEEPDQRAPRPEATGHQSVLDLQRRAGNQAVSAMLRELAPDAVEAASGGRVSAHKLLVVHSDLGSRRWRFFGNPPEGGLEGIPGALDWLSYLPA